MARCVRSPDHESELNKQPTSADGQHVKCYRENVCRTKLGVLCEGLEALAASVAICSLVGMVLERLPLQTRRAEHYPFRFLVQPMQKFFLKRSKRDSNSQSFP